MKRKLLVSFGGYANGERADSKSVAENIGCGFESHVLRCAERQKLPQLVLDGQKRGTRGGMCRFCTVFRWSMFLDAG